MAIPMKPESEEQVYAGQDLRLPAVDHTNHEGSLAALVRDSTIQAERVLRLWLNDSATTIQAILYPALTLLMLWITLGNSITGATGMPSVYGTVPMITLIAAMSGSIVSALGLNQEIRSGLVGRFWTMPINRAAGLIGRMFAEAIRITITTGAIILVGLAIDFRFEQGAMAAIALFGLPVIFGMGFAVAVTALATISDGAVLVSLVGLVTSLLMFFNTGFVPISPTRRGCRTSSQTSRCRVRSTRCAGCPWAVQLLSPCSKLSRGHSEWLPLSYTLQYGAIDGPRKIPAD